jgi:hypothetical protein
MNIPGLISLTAIRFVVFKCLPASEARIQRSGQEISLEAQREQKHAPEVTPIPDPSFKCPV